MTRIGIRQGVDLESLVYRALTDAGLPSGIALPAQWEQLGRFVLFFANGGVDMTPVTTQYRVELEGWGQTPTAAKACLADAVQALERTAGSVVSGQYVRDAEGSGPPVQYDSGAPDKSRYASAVLVTLRPRRVG